MSNKYYTDTYKIYKMQTETEQTEQEIKEAVIRRLEGIRPFEPFGVGMMETLFVLAVGMVVLELVNIPKIEQIKSNKI